MTDSASRFKILKSEDSNRCATFELNDEDHTLGNALRHIILKNPEVKFCGYALPHPNERKINLQIQVFSGTSLDALEKGIKDLIELNKIVREKILAEKERFGPVELVDSEGEGDFDEETGGEPDDDATDEEQELPEEAQPSAEGGGPAADKSGANAQMQEEECW